MFKYIKYFFDAKSAYEKPDEFIADTSMGLVGGFFALGFVGLTVVSAILIYLSIVHSQPVMMYFAFAFIVLLIIEVVVFIKIKAFIQRKTRDIIDSSKEYLEK